ncbi:MULTISPECIES: hypothetical protein [unclassified Aminobacter]|uniref:hypothetical protein n=1 Tax=unclassified Aminobacter TaxID=2644704 RepID=UPI0004652DC2|nr:MULTISPECIES: hypothetical protein [unclassified Aminobacter]TWH35572.1 hypothetical protein L611_001200000530 [Aminobacter sp. J15]
MTTTNQTLRVYRPDVVAVLNGNIDRLMEAFLWEQTPQGTDHWLEIYFGDRELSEEDIAFLSFLKDNIPEGVTGYYSVFLGDEGGPTDDE